MQLTIKFSLGTIDCNNRHYFCGNTYRHHDQRQRVEKPQRYHFHGLPVELIPINVAYDLLPVLVRMVCEFSVQILGQCACSGRQPHQAYHNLDWQNVCLFTVKLWIYDNCIVKVRRGLYTLAIGSRRVKKSITKCRPRERKSYEYLYW